LRFLRSPRNKRRSPNGQREVVASTAALAFLSPLAPWSLDEGELNDWNGGRGVYFKDPNGHVLELMTVPPVT
jgi:hypothetical protein